MSRSVTAALLLVLAAGCGRKPTETDNASGASDDPPPTGRTAGTGRDARPAAGGYVDRPRAADEPAVARRAKEHLKRIGKALHEYESAFGSFPAGVVAPAGKLGLSWRVQLLPYLGEGKLYERFKTTEPWDSPANKPLLAAMPKVFESAGRAAPDGHTYLRSFTGFHALIPGPAPGQPSRIAALRAGVFAPGRSLIGITDGTSNTLAVAEAAEAVPWTKPDELPVTGLVGGPTPLGVPKLGGAFADGFHGLMADGEVRFFPASLSEAALRAVLTTDGGDYDFPPDLEKAVYPNGRPRPSSAPVTNPKK